MMAPPAHIETLASELENFSHMSAEGLAILSPDALRRRLADAAKWLRLLAVASNFMPVSMPGFVCATAEDFFTWHPETWGNPTQFLLTRQLGTRWAVARPLDMKSDGSGYDVAVTWYETEAEAMAGAIWEAADPRNVKPSPALAT